MSTDVMFEPERWQAEILRRFQLPATSWTQPQTVRQNGRQATVTTWTESSSGSGLYYGHLSGLAFDEATMYDPPPWWCDLQTWRDLKRAMLDNQKGQRVRHRTVTSFTRSDQLR